MKTTRKSLILVSLAAALMLLLASCNLGDLFPSKDNDTTTTTTATTHPPADPPIDISQIPDSKGLLYQALDESTCMVYGLGTCRDTVVRIPEVIDGYRVTTAAFVSPKFLEEGNEDVNYRVTTLIIPKTATTISTIAYEGLTSIVVDPENPIYYSEGNCIIEKISKTLVAGCDGSVIPQDIKGIRTQAFSFCSNLTSVSIPAGVTSIEPLCFLGCSKLTTVTVDSNNSAYYAKGTCLIEKATETVIATWGTPVIVPKSVKNIPYPFYDSDMRSLDEVTFEGTKAEWSNVTFNSSYLTLGEIFTVHCTDGDVIIEGSSLSGGNDNCEHIFSSDCDENCDNCYGRRKTNSDHTYSSDCDEWCDNCDSGHRETDIPHTYSFDCDEHCDACGERREPVADHQLDERSMWPDFTCLFCGYRMFEVPIPAPQVCDSCGHQATEYCDTSCDNCGAELTPVHMYSSREDIDCYFCGHIREIED